MRTLYTFITLLLVIVRPLTIEAQTNPISTIFEKLWQQTEPGAYRYEMQQILPILKDSLWEHKEIQPLEKPEAGFSATLHKDTTLQLLSILKRFDKQYQLNYLLRMQHAGVTLCFDFATTLVPLQRRNQNIDTSFIWSTTVANGLYSLKLTGATSGEPYLFLPDATTALLMEKIQERMSNGAKEPFITALDKQLQKIWNHPEAMDQNWDHLKRMITLTSSDKKMKICTYFIPREGFEQEPRGAIVVKNQFNNLVIPLKDQSPLVKSPDRVRLDEKKWYGAVYTELIEVTHKEKTYYTLLGFKSNDGLVKTRLIDVLIITNNKAWFGAPIFRNDKQTLYRPIFQYSADANMMMRYDPQIKGIVLDNLSPNNPVFMGQPRFYGPDFTYNAYLFEKGIWQFNKEVDLRNPGNKKKPNSERKESY